MDSRITKTIRAALADPRYLGARLSQAGWQLKSRLGAYRKPLGNGDIECRALGKYRLVVKETDVGLAPTLIEHGSWELWITRLMMRRIHPGAVCLDAGANLGYFSLLMADLAGPTGRVIAAEPVADTMRLLRQNLSANGFADRVDLIDCALGARGGENVTLLIPEGEPKNALIEPEGLDYGHGRNVTRVNVPMMSVDEMKLPRLDFAKIDVEGGELGVWLGMQATLDRSPTAEIILEFNNGRGPDVDIFVDSICERYPLRMIDTVGNIHRTTRQALLEGPPEDVMLYLAR